MIDKIKLDLFKLKSKENLIRVQQLSSEYIKRWFNDDGGTDDRYFKDTSCPFCASDLSFEKYKIDGFSYHRCEECDSIYTKPHLRSEVLDEIYTDGTYQFYQNNLVKTGTKIRKGLLEKRKFKQINELLNKQSISLLDVGCGGGTFMDICKEHGWKVQGIDPSFEVVQNHESVIMRGDFNTTNISNNFDLITFWGVLEHMVDPVYAISKAERILNSDGMIVFEVPSSDCFLSEYLKKHNFQPTRYIESGVHNIFFSKLFIESIAKKLNLEIVLIETNGLDIQTILLEELSENLTKKIINMQDTLNDLLLGDHYRVFLKKISGKSNSKN